MVIITNILKEKVWIGDIDLDDDTFNVILCSGVGSLDTSVVQSWNTYSDVSAYEVDGTGYSIGGKALANVGTSSADGDATKRKWYADDVTWENATISIDSAAIYDTTVNNTLVSVHTLAPTISSGGDFTLNWNSQGILTLS